MPSAAASPTLPCFPSPSLCRKGWPRLCHPGVGCAALCEQGFWDGTGFSLRSHGLCGPVTKGVCPWMSISLRKHDTSGQVYIHSSVLLIKQNKIILLPFFWDGFMCPGAGGTRSGGTPVPVPLQQHCMEWVSSAAGWPVLKASHSQDGAEHEGTPCSILGQPGSACLAKCAAVWPLWLWHWIGEFSSTLSPFP